MKKIIFLSFLISSTFIIKAHAQKPYSMSLNFEISTPTDGYGFGLTKYFSIKKQDKFYFGIGAFAGSEKGYYEDGLYSTPHSNSFLNQVEGSSIISSNQIGVKSDWYFGGKATINYVVVLKKNRRRITDYMVLTLGLRFSSHPETIGEFSVTSEDSSFRYNKVVKHKYDDSYTNFSPEIGISSGLLGLYYSYQKHPTDNEFHTIGLKINIE